MRALEHAEWCDQAQHDVDVALMDGDSEWTACFRVVGDVPGVGEVWKIATDEGPRIVVDAPGVDLNLHPSTVRAVGEMLTRTPENELVHVAVTMPSCIAAAVLALPTASLRAIGRVLVTL